jgi:dynein heavy chain
MLSQIGDVLLASAFVSYAGPFNMLLRNQLVEARWRPDLIQRNIPLSEGIKPLDLLTDDTARAKWANEGLPIDPLSVENGAIMTNASRWPLMIDPQLQVSLECWLQYCSTWLDGTVNSNLFTSSCNR